MLVWATAIRAPVAEDAGALRQHARCDVLDARVAHPRITHLVRRRKLLRVAPIVGPLPSAIPLPVRIPSYLRGSTMRFSIGGVPRRSLRPTCRRSLHGYGLRVHLLLVRLVVPGASRNNLRLVLCVVRSSVCPDAVRAARLPAVWCRPLHTEVGQWLGYRTRSTSLRRISGHPRSVPRRPLCVYCSRLAKCAVARSCIATCCSRVV
jgi:hypothetical protein